MTEERDRFVRSTNNTDEAEATISAAPGYSTPVDCFSDTKCQRYEERIVELHSVIAELSQKLQVKDNDTIEEESDLLGEVEPDAYQSHRGECLGNDVYEDYDDIGDEPHYVNQLNEKNGDYEDFENTAEARAIVFLLSTSVVKHESLSLEIYFTFPIPQIIFLSSTMLTFRRG